jgi:hypothetical protein
MNAIHVHVDEDLADRIPELRTMMGQDVELTVRALPPIGYEPQETLETFLGDALTRPPPNEVEMAELRALAETEPAVAAALRMAEGGGLDVETILAIRNAE